MDFSILHQMEIFYRNGNQNLEVERDRKLKRLNSSVLAQNT